MRSPYKCVKCCRSLQKGNRLQRVLTGLLSHSSGGTAPPDFLVSYLRRPLRFKGIAAKVQSAQTSVIKWPCLAEGQGLQVLFLPLTQHELGAQPCAVIGQTNIHPIIKCTQVPQLWQLLTTRSLTRHTGSSPPSQVGHFGN